MAGSYEDYKTYLNDLYKDVLKKTATVNYDTRSPGQLKAMLEGYLKPGLDKNIAAREQQGRANAASIDSDAAARGMGGSTWLTDMKNRQNNAVASDIAGMRNDYNSNLFNSLLSKLSEQDSRKISVDEYNATQKNKALDRAFAAANQNINSWAKAASGGRGGKQQPGSLIINFGSKAVEADDPRNLANYGGFTPTDKSKTATARLNQIVGAAMLTPSGQDKLRKAIYGK